MKKQAVFNEEAENESTSENAVLKKITDKPGLVKPVLYFLFGLTCGLFPESYIVSPFAAAAVASSPAESAFFTFLGGSAGFLITRGIKGSVRYIITLCFAFTSVRVAHSRFFSLDRSTVSALLTSVFVLLSDILEMVSVRVTLIGSVLCACDAVLCACAVWFFSRSLSVPLLKIGIRRISSRDLICICITAACLICCVGKISVRGFYPFHIPACLLIIFCSFYGRAAGGSVSGVLLGLVLAFGCETPSLFYMYAAGGLLSGVFSFIGQRGCAAVFAVAAVAASFIYGGSEDVFPFIAESVLSALIFMVIPSKWLCRAQEYLTKSGLINDAQINMRVALSLREASETLGSIGGVISEVNEKLGSLLNPETSKTLARIQLGVCNGCEHKSLCWNEDFDSTVSTIDEIAALRLSSHPVTPETLPTELSRRCPRLDSLSDEILRDYKQYLESQALRMKTDEMREIVSDQFSSMAQLLSDMSALIEDEKVYDESRSLSLRKMLRDSNIKAETASYRENSYSRATVEISLCEEPNKINSDKIKKLISSFLGEKFKDAEITVEDFHTVLTFHEKSEYLTNIGIKQIPCGSGGVCGDCADTFDNRECFTVAAISDGMGTGKRASLDAEMTSGIMNRLLASGFSFKSALRLVNSALLIKNGEESMASVDVAFINTYNAVCTFYKAGAAASYVKKGEKVSVVESPSLPVGILRDIDFYEERVQLESGDTVLMISDGVSGGGDEWLRETLLCWSTDNMQELATHIADLARRKNEKLYPDDITVIAIKIKKANK